jgi:hypothetical protein
LRPLVYVVEPQKLLLLWQPADLTSPGRTRRVVGEFQKNDSGQTVFRYLREEAEFQAACSEGFQGFPAFALKSEETREGVVEALMRRLPPRNREDSGQFLAQHGLPSPFLYSDLALLGYTGAHLPSDGFSVAPIFPSGLKRCDYMMEVAGVRHVYKGEASSLRPGAVVRFSKEAENKIDVDAVAIYIGSNKLGFVNRGLRQTFNEWITNRRVEGTIFRVSESVERPRVFVRVEVR